MDVSTAMYGDENKKPRARVDINRATSVDDVKLNEEITIVIKGVVKSIRGPEESMRLDYVGKGKEKEKKVTYPGCLEVEVASMKITGDYPLDPGEDD